MPLTNAERRQRYYQRHKAAHLAAGNEYRHRNRAQVNERMYLNSLRRLYGVSLMAYAFMLVAQQSRCAICRRRPGEQGVKQRLCVDHNHETGAVRGLLCNECNRGLGLLQTGNLCAAIGYLKGEFDNAGG